MIHKTETSLEKTNSKVVEFPIDKGLNKKIELMIKRITDDDENDNCLIIEGDTGSGKTNMSVGIAYKVAVATGRTFDNTRIFFDTDKAVEFAKSTKRQIIIFDEPAFGGLKSEWRTKTQTNLIKLLFTARLKRHFMIFNLVKFSKFNDDIIDKAVALIRIYKRNESKKERRFLYIPHKRIPGLLDLWKRKHIRKYSKFAVLHGTVFRYVLPEIIDQDLYNKVKEEAIMSIGQEESKGSDKYKTQWEDLGKHLINLDYPLLIENPSQLAQKVLNKPKNFMTSLRERAKKKGFLQEKKVKSYELAPLIIDNGSEGSENG